MVLYTSEELLTLVKASALHAFARGGYHGTTVSDVAHEAKISPAYVFKLFPSKERLFVAALDDCFARVVDALRTGADESHEQTPTGILDAMGDAYAHLISDRDLLMIQVHAQSVANIPEVRQSLRAGLARVTRFASSRSGADDEAVQRFIAYGQLCHLIVTVGLEDIDEGWAEALSRGITHPD